MGGQFALKNTDGSPGFWEDGGTHVCPAFLVLSALFLGNTATLKAIWASCSPEMHREWSGSGLHSLNFQVKAVDQKP